MVATFIDSFFADTFFADNPGLIANPIPPAHVVAAANGENSAGAFHFAELGRVFHKNVMPSLRHAKEASATAYLWPRKSHCLLPPQSVERWLRQFLPARPGSEP